MERADDVQWMERALSLARLAVGQTRPNPAVGAVIVSSEGAVLGEGWHERAGAPHAEVEALADARRRNNNVSGATIYVTLEPCNHHGRTPPCVDAILGAGLSRVVVAQRDPHITARGGVERLRDAGVEVDCGILRREALLLNAPFNIFHTLKRPLFTLKWAMTMDGCTGLPSGDSKWITGEVARAEVHRRRAAHDAVMAGIGTVVADGARLTARLEPGDPGLPPPGMRRRRIVVDTELKLPIDAPFLEMSKESEAVVFCAEDAEPSRMASLLERGAQVLPVKRGPYGVSIPDLVFNLYELGIQSVYVEGGRRFAGALARHGMADRVESWIGARVAGGAQGPHLGPLASPAPLSHMADARHLQGVEVKQFGADLLIEGWLLDWDGLAESMGAP